MAPKVKSSTPLPPEAMATQHPSDDVAQQCGLPEPPPTTNRRNTVKRRRAPEPLTETDSSQAAAMSTPKRRRSCGKSKTVKDKHGKHGLPAPGTPRGRPSKESLFISAVATKCSVHQHVVETVLRAVEKVAVQALRDKRKFNVSFIQGRLNEKPEAPAKEKKVLGKLVSVPARPAKRTVKFIPSKEFRKLFE